MVKFNGDITAFTLKYVMYVHNFTKHNCSDYIDGINTVPFMFHPPTQVSKLYTPETLIKVENDGLSVS